MSDEQRDQIVEELARLREEVTNSRNLTIKTDNVLKNLSTEIKTIADRQGSLRRRNWINSVGAYLIFTVLVFVGANLTFQARLEKQKVERALSEKNESAYKQQLADLQAELGRWKQIERELLEFERMVRDGNKEQAVAKFSVLRRVRFSGLLEDLVSRFKAEVAKDKYEQGLEHYKKGTFDKADEAFIKSLEYEEAPDYLSDLLYHQGMSALRMKDFPRAAELLRRALDDRLPWRTLAEIRYHLAYAHDRMGEKRTARNLYQYFFTKHEKHAYAKAAKRRYQQLKKD